MIGIDLSPFTAQSRSATLARLAELAGLAGATPQATSGGKPYLQGLAGTDHGLAITHLRKAKPPQSLMAVAQTPFLGLDAELWPQGPGDPGFLAAVAAPEEESLIRRLAASGHDAGLFLWVAKEAALKASGEVMTDPRDIFVEPSINGHFCAATSRNSRKPVPPAILRICRFSAITSDAPALLAVAISGDLAGTANLQPIGVNSPELALADVF